MVLISFIVPAYNAASYLQDCLSSIYAVDFGGYAVEVIVVDDGSTDETPALLSGFAVDHPDLRIVRQENRGLGASRNAGLSVAVGKYVCFVDADDQLDVPGASHFPFACLEREDIDLYGVDARQVCGRSVKPYRRYVPVHNRLYCPAVRFMKGRNLFPCAWAYLYRREFLVAIGLKFHEGIFHEDEEWTPLVFSQAASFVALKVDFYLYFVRPGSITTTSDLHRREQNIRYMLEVIRTLDAYLQSHPDLRPYMATKLDYLCVDLLLLLRRRRFSALFRKEMVSALRALGYFPLRRNQGWKYKAFSLLTRCIY